MDYSILAITLPLLAFASGVSLRRRSLGADWTGLAGLGCTLLGDFFLAMNHAPRDSWGFVLGVAGFSLTHLWWMVHLWRGGCRPCMPMALALLTAFLPYLNCRVLPNAVPKVGVAIVVYAVLSCFSLAWVVGSGKILWMLAIGALFLSDFFISAGSFTDEPLLGRYVVRVYLVALLSAASAVVFSRPVVPLPYRLQSNRKAALALALILYSLAALAFVLAMAHAPSGHYNPLRQMLSYLGRTEVDGVPYPPCHYLFVLGMAASALSFAIAMPHLAMLAPGSRTQALARYGGAGVAGGLLMIALIPENVDMAWHCHGCDVAALGGALLLFMLRPRCWWEWLLFAEVGVALVAFALCVQLDRADVIPFSPWVPSFQKLLILSFMAWCVVQCMKAWRQGNSAKGE